MKLTNPQTPHPQGHQAFHAAAASMKHNDTIHIAASKKGTFTAEAKKEGRSVQAEASHIMANKSQYSPAMVKKAVFAHNFAH